MLKEPARPLPLPEPACLDQFGGTRAHVRRHDRRVAQLGETSAKEANRTPAGDSLRQLFDRMATLHVGTLRSQRRDEAKPGAVSTS